MPTLKNLKPIKQTRRFYVIHVRLQFISILISSIDVCTRVTNTNALGGEIDFEIRRRRLLIARIFIEFRSRHSTDACSKSNTNTHGRATIHEFYFEGGKSSCHPTSARLSGSRGPNQLGSQGPRVFPLQADCAARRGATRRVPTRRPRRR